jgi:hypothetical protein
LRPFLSSLETAPCLFVTKGRVVLTDHERQPANSNPPENQPSGWTFVRPFVTGARSDIEEIENQASTIKANGLALLLCSFGHI